MFRSIPDIGGQASCRSVYVCVMFSFLRLCSQIFVDLSKKIHAVQLKPDILVGKYILNLVAKKFCVSREYAYDQTSSPRLNKVLKKWGQNNWASRQKFGYLAYQFTSPVRWIETQDLLFEEFAFERFIEIGPSPL
jgi:fatty acid synthase subunit alpha, fungi type